MVGSYGFVVPDSCAGVSFTVAMALSRQSCADASLMVAMALLCQIAVRAYPLRELWLCCAKAVRTSRDGNYGFVPPKLCGRIEAIAKACAPKLCTVERTGQGAEAKIGFILVLCG